MVYSKAKMKRNDVKASPCFRPFSFLNKELKTQPNTCSANASDLYSGVRRKLRSGYWEY
jgi:hypothetical protein